MIPTIQDGEEAFYLNKQIENNELERRKLLAKNAELLSILKDKELYKVILGDEKAQWSAYLGSIEIMYSRSNIHNMIRINNKFIKELNISYELISDIPRSRLVTLLPIINASNFQEWIDKARTLTNFDFKDEVRIAKGLKPMEECEHKYKSYQICSICGTRHQLEEKCDETKQSLSK